MAARSQVHSRTRSLGHEIDELCDEFEAAWKRESPLSIEGLLERTPSSIHPPLLRELLHLDLEYRRGRRERPEQASYAIRFPQHANIVAEVFREFEVGVDQTVTPSNRESCETPDFQATLAHLPSDSPKQTDPDQTSVPSQPLAAGHKPRSVADEQSDQNRTDCSPLPQPADNTDSISLPEKIGRYLMRSILGEGGFGRVYLAYDDQLKRLVAIKVPHASLVARAEDAEPYLAEARTVAGLDHAHIVPVYDVSGTAECPFFIVSKYIEGSDLARKIKHARYSYTAAAELVATVADALHYAHKQGLVHRDIKPGNLLIDGDDKPYVVDFGLALREENLGQGPRFAGTPAYMSPEQARGEGHRVDGRSDIFSLGVVLYELLVGRRPFSGATSRDLLEQITTLEAKPPRQIDDSIPHELERICLKTLSKRATERYTTAHDLADDLRHFSESLQIAHNARPALLTPVGQTSGETAVATGTPVATPTPESTQIRIVPKGLRSFDARDADFFLELLPGPRDRDGLPDSIRFWKTRIEETDVDQTFSVGLIYGPSGCGKSSLVKAGLLPRLSHEVLSVYVEASPDNTETRLLHGLRKRCPGLPDSLDLKETLTALRRGQSIPVGKKVLIVLDQFEQWLHAWRNEETTELVQALRQCDGGQVQCVVMVRDDFWMAATRLMRELEIQLVEGHNSNAVDLFPARHARKVLAAFGQAFGNLPQDADPTSKPQHDFLDQAVVGLAEDGKVICVRLALFAEMMKGKAWTPAALKEVGGTQGVGVTFLEETFSASTAPPEHRYHQKAARAVLKALLPEQGTDIKGQMRSEQDLLVTSGYQNRSKDFAELLRILDSELRLITPTDPEGSDSDPASPRSPGKRYYQLTHDYLVHSLRDWLTRKQRETRRGRAELLLAERSAAWNTKPENRLLPSGLEWARVRLLTQRAKWTPPQARTMRRAGRVHGQRFISAGCIVLLSLVAAWLAIDANRQSRAAALVDAVLTAPPEAVPYATANLRSLPNHAVPLLKARFQDTSLPVPQRVNAACALADFDEVNAEFLVYAIRFVKPVECANILAALEHAPEAAIPVLRDEARNAETFRDRNAETVPDWKQKARVAIVAMYLGDVAIARDMLQVENRPDPIQRTVFIDTFATWRHDLAKLAGLMAQNVDGPLRSGIVLGVVSVEDADARTRKAWEPVLADWFVQQSDAVTHSAVGLALRRWKLPEPKVEMRDPLDRKLNWMVTKTGLTMIRVPAGRFERRDPFPRPYEGKAGPPQQITLTRDIWMGDREVSVGLFRTFIEDKDYVGLRPQSWECDERGMGCSPDHPVWNVNWYDAVMFCNWLSLQEGRTPCYELSGEKETYMTMDEENRTITQDFAAWRLVDGASGYRLPTEAEWEYACRAGTTTNFAMGGKEERPLEGRLLGRYAVYAWGKIHGGSDPVGSKLCNGWGLFDMHGNAAEWCQDWYANYENASQSNPSGPASGSSRVHRGGDASLSVYVCDSKHRSSCAPSQHAGLFYSGFRCVRVW